MRTGSTLRCVGSTAANVGGSTSRGSTRATPSGSNSTRTCWRRWARSAAEPADARNRISRGRINCMTMATGSISTSRPWAERPDAVLTAVGTTADGLSGAEAAARLVRDGRNELPAPKQQPAWRRFLAHFDDVLVYILIAAAVLKAISGDWVDFVVIAVVIV